MYGQMGQIGDAEEAVREITRLAPNLRLEHTSGLLMVRDATAKKRFIDGLRKVGFPE